MLGTILGFFFVTLPLAAILGIVGFILGIVGLRKAREIGVGRGMAITGIVTSIVGVGGVVLWGVLIAVFFTTAGDLDEDFFEELEQELEELEQLDDDL